MNKPIICCLKIRSATLLIGTLDLMFHVLLLTMLLASLSNLSPIDQYYSNSVGLITFSSVSLSSSSCISASALTVSPSQRNEEPIALPFAERPGRLKSVGSPSTIAKDKSMAFMITIFSALITSMLIYGVIKHRPSYLMPYFSVKVFQVVVASLTTLGFYTCLPNVRLWIESHEHFPLKSTLLLVDNQTLELFVFTLLLFSILIKLYEAIIVWYCYRYMVTIESFRSLNGGNNSGTNNGIVFTDDDGSNFVVKMPDEESTMGGPPKYDEIFKGKKNSKSQVGGPSTSRSDSADSEPAPSYPAIERIYTSCLSTNTTRIYSPC